MIARFAALLSLALAIPVHANPLDCGGGDFTIEAPTEDLTATICAALLDARAALQDCGLEQTRPIAVEVTPGISHPIGECLSYFECDFDVIRVIDPAALPEALDPGDAYAVLPPEVLLTSLLTHELVHALVTQSAGDRRIDIVDQEYIAAALELETMAPDWRDALIRAAPVSLPPKDSLIDILIYGMAPRKFATNAWQYFQAEDDGCARVREIVAGRFSFAR